VDLNWAEKTGFIRIFLHSPGQVHLSKPCKTYVLHNASVEDQLTVSPTPRIQTHTPPHTHTSFIVTHRLPVSCLTYVFYAYYVGVYICVCVL
jgi:hypothetical protein